MDLSEILNDFTAFTESITNSSFNESIINVTESDFTGGAEESKDG